MRTAREVLDVIDGFFADLDVSATERQGLWNVLTALRGPDRVGEDAMKLTATVPIRRRAFPRLTTLVSTARPAAFDLIEGLGVEGEVQVPDHGRVSESAVYHFRRHILAAAKVLGMTVRIVHED